jgi:hypothetical protein
VMLAGVPGQPGSHVFRHASQLVFAGGLCGSHRQSAHVLTRTNEMSPGLPPDGLSLRLTSQR